MGIPENDKLEVHVKNSEDAYNGRLEPLSKTRKKQ